MNDQTINDQTDARRQTMARVGHGIIAAVVIFGVIGELILTIQGARPSDDPSLPERLRRFVLYFTIESNLIALVASISLVIRPQRDGPVWRVVRLDAVLAMMVTAVVHWIFLRPAEPPPGFGNVTDTTLHVVSPALVLLGWLLLGPRPRIALKTVGLALLWPVAYLIVIMVQSAVTGWYPYNFLDVGQNGVASVAVFVAIMIGAVVAFGLLLAGIERLLPATPGLTSKPLTSKPRSRVIS